MIILGIETSCDDTAIAIVKGEGANFEILADFVSSQEKLHSGYGGVFPALAKREHQKNILPILVKSLKKVGMLQKNENGLDDKKIKKLEVILERNPELFRQLKIFLEKYQKPTIDKINVTIGPGLEPCLYVGVNFAKALSFYWNIEINAVHHLEGHLLANYIEQDPKILFPALGLIVSGGNTQIVLIENIGKYKIIGETRDDAAGECFDKTARLLGLGYPGGKKISELANKAKTNKFNIVLPRPMIHEKNFDFSFSGLKTAVLYETKKRSQKELESEEYRTEISKEIENAIVEVLVKKLEKSIEKHEAKSIIIGGGVSANKKLKKEIRAIAKKKNINFSAPKIKYSADNAAMIAIIPLLSSNFKKISWSRIKPSANLKINGL
ncbi:MAG: tRNA (adenosine(37)-N6)-threonylcarbamoyltransferase complex transferase subunit TsaD [Candidatus Paceibacterota bacterium]|jgi:N6-L-threonylcarbamoyladenine synthase|nr:tRNA (adenosine(37)-N6)-threonylcarbamoyltransferase complex transferase subunit TsaD [bacterium]